MGIQVDEALDAPAWRLTLESPYYYLSIQINSARALSDLMGFLRRTREAASIAADTHQLGRWGPEFAWDLEHPRRLYIWFRRGGQGGIHITLSEAEVNGVIAALEEASASD